MISELLIISSFIISFLGIFIILAMISKQEYDKVLIKINSLPLNLEQFSCKSIKISLLYLCIKRILDIVVSLISMIIFAPIFVFIALSIKVDSKGPVFVKFKRRGKYGNVFYAFKYRTMYIIEDLTEGNRLTSSSDPRITRFGKFLRSANLDDLPNLINVLLGYMSLVGTSIAQDYEYTKIPNDYKKIIHKFKPGLTSLWSVSFDKQTYTYEGRLFVDLYYAENHSLRLDLSVLIKALILSLGITASR